MMLLGAVGAARAGADGAGASGDSAPGVVAQEETENDPLWPVRAPTKARGATVARIVVPTRGRLRLSSPGRTTRVGTETAWSEQNQTLLALDSAERGGIDWVKVLLGSRPNGRAAWVRRDHVVLGTTRYWIDVSTRLRRVTVYRDGKRIRRFRAVVGAPRTPTPHTLAAVYEVNRQPDPTAFLGPWVLALTAHSTVLRNYGGGPGRAALHGRGGESLRDRLGSARSHGCVRVTNADVRFLAQRVPQGTPVDLRR
ncbi:MAG: L,D-transpeptidase [Patulibacter sp.]|nr:L,D-transpeptidase [Patulibacter sp.]